METYEPAQVTLPSNVLRVVVVNNVVEQPENIGHNLRLLGSTNLYRDQASSDSIAIFYTEALAQFIDEEDYFLDVAYYNRPLRSDEDFLSESLLPPDDMNKIRIETGANAIISLDRLIIETEKKELFRQRYQDYTFCDLKGKIESTLRIYLPTMDGKIPVIKYSDSLSWEGFDIGDNRAYSEMVLPSREEAMKILAVRAAEKMSYLFAPHWKRQDRWYYTMSSSLMRKGEAFAEKTDWPNAISNWETFFNSRSNKVEKAKAANNLALAYEMKDNMEEALYWAKIANQLFSESTSPNSLEQRRGLLYMMEIERRLDMSNRLNMQK